MSTELHLSIHAESAADALRELAEISQRAAKELGVGQPPNTSLEAKPNGAAEPRFEPRPAPASAGENLAREAASFEKKSRKKSPALDRDEIIKGLTDAFVAGDEDVKARITSFRDQHGVQRLRELKDDAMGDAFKLLNEIGEP